MASIMELQEENRILVCWQQLGRLKSSMLTCPMSFSVILPGPHGDKKYGVLPVAPEWMP